MKILIVASEIIKNKYSASLTVYKFIQAIPKSITYDILTEPMTEWDFEHRTFEIFYTSYKIPQSSKLTIKEKIFARIFNINLRHRLRYKGFLKKLSGIKLNNYDAIIAFGGGGFFEPHKAVSLQNTNAKKIGFIHDPYPADIFPEPYKTKSSKNTLKIRKEINLIFQKLDILAFPSILLMQWMNKFYNFSEYKSVVLPHLIPQIKFDSKSREEAKIFFKKHNLKPNQFYLHTGTLLKHRPIKEIINQFLKLKNENYLSNDMKLVFIGKIKYEIENNFKDVIIINDRLSLNFINVIAQEAKALMIIEHIGKISPFLPGKLPEYIALKKPIMHFGPIESEVCRISKTVVNLSEFSAELNKPIEINKVLKYGGHNLSESKDFVDYFKIDNFFYEILK